MFGGLTGSQGSTQTDFGEKLLNTVASQSIRRLFSQSDFVEVLIRCFPSSKLLQGSIDSLKMQGRGLVIRRQFQVENMSFETDAIALDFGSVLKGQLRLKQPTQAIAQVTLSEEGINEAFKADLVRKRLQDVELPEGSAVSGTASFSEIEIKLRPANHVQIQAKVQIPDQAPVPIAVDTVLAVERRRRILFSSPQFLADLIPDDLQAVSAQMTQIFVELLDNMIVLDRFDLDGVDLKVNRVETQQEQLLITGYAQINHFPGMKP